MCVFVINILLLFLLGSSYPPHAPPFTGVPSPLPPVETLAVAAAIPPPATYSHHPSFVGLPATSKTHPSRPAPPTLSSDPTIFTGKECIDNDVTSFVFEHAVQINVFFSMLRIKMVVQTACQYFLCVIGCTLLCDV